MIDFGIQIEIRASPRGSTDWSWSWRVFCSQDEDWSGVTSSLEEALIQSLTRMGKITEKNGLRTK